MTWLKRDDFQVICSIEDKSLFDVWECLGKSMMMLQWQLISCRTCILHIRWYMCSTVHNLLNMMAIIWRTNSTRNWFWNVSKKSMMSLQPNCSDNNFYPGIRCFLAKHQRVFRFVVVFFGNLLVGSVGWLCWTGKFEKSDGVITLWPKKIVFIFRSEESTTEKSGNKTCFTLQVYNTINSGIFLNHSSWK